MNASLCKVRTMVPHSIWHFCSKSRYAIFQCNEYYWTRFFYTGNDSLYSRVTVCGYKYKVGREHRRGRKGRMTGKVWPY